VTDRQYAAAGVDLRQLDSAKRRIAALVEGTRTTWSRGGAGGFGGMVRVPDGLERPLLVMSTDGVGTKVMVARMAGVYDTVGQDLVNHSVNDILVHGAIPLAFQDYIGANGLTEHQLAAIVEGVARGCREHEIALSGGETAALPDLYAPGDFDLAGTIVGVVEESAALHGDQIAPGDVLLAYGSSGLHTNGYTLARRILFDRLKLSIGSPLSETGSTVGEALLAVHRSYLGAVRPVLGLVHGIAHITGGGIAGNLVRILPPSVEALVDASSWTWPPLFSLLMRAGSLSLDEMREVFNLGIGLLAVLRPADLAGAAAAARAAGVPVWVAGEIRAAPIGRGGGEGRVRFA
jgi:phosphoribosylformylglycinamidine cyclo-ligase